MKNILRSRPRTVPNRPTSGGWGNKKCFFPADSGRPGANRPVHMGGSAARSQLARQTAGLWCILFSSFARRRMGLTRLPTQSKACDCGTLNHWLDYFYQLLDSCRLLANNRIALGRATNIKSI